MIRRGNTLSSPRKILVRATNWIGDGVMSLPALEALRARFPTAEIVLLAKPWVSELYWYHPAVSRHMVYNPGGEHKGPRGFAKLVRALKAEGFDAAILFQNAFQAAWMAWRADIPARIGYARDGRGVLLTSAVEPPPPAACRHQAHYYLQLLLRAGLIDKPKPVQGIRLAIPEAERKWARKYLTSRGLTGRRFLVGLSPGASFGPAKRWLPERFAALADRLVGAVDADVLIFGSPEEKPLAEAVAGRMSHAAAILTGETTLRQWLALLTQCRLIVSNDSGAMHLAAGLGLPQVAVFGSTDERATGPMNSRARTIRHHVACSPCGLRECPIDFRCMTSITVDEVYQVALELVKETQE